MYLKQSTASQSREIGPFVSDSDFKTAQTGLTIANTDVKLSANGAAGANKNSGGGTHRNNGMYSLTFDATDTATVGELAGSVIVTGALPVAFKFYVLEEAVYDAWFAASAVGYVTDQPVNVTKVGGTSQTARDLGANLDAAVTTRMATYTQPSGFLAATFPGTVASTTNITGGTITTVTNLTNAPTAGDLTATMKTSVTTAASSATPALSAAGVDAILDDTIGDGSMTMRQALRVILAASAGRLSGAATTTITIRNTANSADVIVATVDANGNRSAVTITP